MVDIPKWVSDFGEMAVKNYSTAFTAIGDTLTGKQSIIDAGNDIAGVYMDSFTNQTPQIIDEILEHRDEQLTNSGIKVGTAYYDMQANGTNVIEAATNAGLTGWDALNYGLELLPFDLTKTVKTATDGNADQITGEDVALSALDLVGLIPGGGVLAKLAKGGTTAAKTAKIVGKAATTTNLVGTGAILAAPTVETFNEVNKIIEASKKETGNDTDNKYITSPTTSPAAEYVKTDVMPTINTDSTTPITSPDAGISLSDTLKKSTSILSDNAALIFIIAAIIAVIFLISRRTTAY